MAIDLSKKKHVPAQLGFLGSVTFCGSYVYEDRFTRLMDFGVMVDWMRSAHDYFTQMVMAGDYDGSEIFVDVYEYEGDGEVSDFDYNRNLIVDQFIISTD